MRERGLHPSQRELADHTGLEPLYVSKLARGLEADGLIKRAPDPADSRGAAVAHRRGSGGHPQRHRDRPAADGPHARAARRPRRHADRRLRRRACPASRRSARPGVHSPEGAAMTTPTLSTQVIGRAESALGAILDPLLKRAEMTFNQWLV